MLSFGLSPTPRVTGTVTRRLSSRKTTPEGTCTVGSRVSEVFDRVPATFLLRSTCDRGEGTHLGTHRYSPFLSRPDT